MCVIVGNYEYVVALVFLVLAFGYLIIREYLQYKKQVKLIEKGMYEQKSKEKEFLDFVRVTLLILSPTLSLAGLSLALVGSVAGAVSLAVGLGLVISLFGIEILFEEQQ